MYLLFAPKLSEALYAVTMILMALLYIAIETNMINVHRPLQIRQL